MVCPACYCVGPVLLGGGLGSLAGGIFRTDQSQLRTKVLSAVLSTGLTGLTMLAVKALAGISPCGGLGLTLTKSVTIATTWSAVGLIYFLGINHLLNKRIVKSLKETPPLQQELPKKEAEEIKEVLIQPASSCCCPKKEA